MPRLLAFVVSFFWMSAFALLALAAAGMLAPTEAGTAAGAAAPFFAVGFLLVAATFLWGFIAVILDDGAAPGNVDWIMRVAIAGAILMATMVLLVMAPEYPVASLAGALLTLSALAASALVVVAECRAARDAAKENRTAGVVGLMAAGAAHNTMLSAISGRAGAERGGR